MQVAILTFDGFNELDSFIALGLLNRLKPLGWSAELAGPGGAGDVLERGAARKLRLDVRPQRAQQFAARAQLAAEPFDVEPVQQVGLVVGRAAEHRAIDVREVRARFDGIGDAAVDDHLQLPGRSRLSW